MNIDPKYIAAGVGVLGILGLAVTGYVRITTPEAAQCAVDLASTKARMEGLVEVKDACKTALSMCAPAKGTP